MLKQGSHISKDPENDSVLCEDNLVQSYFDMLFSFDEFISKKYVDEKLLTILISTFKFLKNCAVNEALRKKYFEKKNFEIIIKYLHFFELDEYNLEYHSE